MKFDVEGLIDNVLIVDEAIFNSNWEAIKVRAAEQQVALDKAAGFSVNSGSRIDLEALLIEKLGFEPQFTKSKKVNFTRKRRPSFAKEVLATYDHPIARQLTEIRSTLAVDKAFRFTEPTINDGSITYGIQPESVTGRIYGEKPPVHALPAEIREAIFPETDHTFIVADYKSQELCIIAHICGCKKLLDELKAGVDIMEELAYEGFDREKVKVAIYAYMYGSIPEHMAYNLNIPIDQIKTFLETLFKRYPEFSKWMDCRDQVNKQGWSETIFGDRYTVNIRKPEKRDEEVRRALNFIAQGSAAGSLYRAIQGVAAEKDLTVKVGTFDALLIQCPTVSVSDCIDKVQNIFDGVLPGVLQAKVTHGSNWREAWKPTEVKAT